MLKEFKSWLIFDLILIRFFFLYFLLQLKFAWFRLVLTEKCGSSLPAGSATCASTKRANSSPRWARPPRFSFTLFFINLFKSPNNWRLRKKRENERKKLNFFFAILSAFFPVLENNFWCGWAVVPILRYAKAWQPAVRQRLPTGSATAESRVESKTVAVARSLTRSSGLGAATSQRFIAVSQPSRRWCLANWFWSYGWSTQGLRLAQC